MRNVLAVIKKARANVLCPWVWKTISSQWRLAFSGCDKNYHPPGLSPYMSNSQLDLPSPAYLV
ncbi:uncharacterized protein PHALS_01525 [Plasmopara halstedii]|uniref:Uncharacterized protein n=1 Tax=Plasmopara halstedii TaxID=4781 RepID=A0A0P1AUS9_PLAHL|nr:uncharacterized protein PHALS_01525 [Plasmopara halstedii]CEG45212.1 hypothetical protein PHALS_01525 [Plasmopara halstedii]|eukprot:XP_024581581.1 hypothetical protein PHALS_01525 [Plasmopara halstedii]